MLTSHRNFFTAVFCVTICCIYSSYCFAQENNSIYNYHDTSRINHAYGSAKTMMGKTHIINCFVSAGRKTWKQSEKDETLRKEQAGIYWLKKQAAKWIEENLDFSVSNLGYERDITLEKIEKDREPKNLKVKWVHLVLNTIGITDVYQYYDSVKNANNANNVVVLIFAKSVGRSYAQSAYSNYKNNDYFLEGAVIYSETFSGLEESPATIIHEMLHLFGARDIYISSTQNEEAVSKMNSVFPMSIMLDTHREIGPLIVEQFTAWCIGWSHSFWGWYDFFMPANRNNLIKQ
jgi:hypothetical protein